MMARNCRQIDRNCGVVLFSFIQIHDKYVTLLFFRGRIFREGFSENIMFSKIHLEDICGIIYVYMISIPCLCKYMATWVGKFTMHGPMGRARGPGPAAGVPHPSIFFRYYYSLLRRCIRYILHPDGPCLGSMAVAKNE